MGLITTQSIGFGDPKPQPNQKADPKPVTGFDYAGQPIKPGGYYNGRPEHQSPDTAHPEDATTSSLSGAPPNFQVSDARQPNKCLTSREISRRKKISEGMKRFIRNRRNQVHEQEQ